MKIRIPVVIIALGVLLIGSLTLSQAAPGPGQPAAATAKPANVLHYSVSPDLHEVKNLKDFRKGGIPLSPAEKSALARQLLVCRQTDADQMFSIYENNYYAEVPSFVTSDLVLQLYHEFFDYALRDVETEKLYPILIHLTNGMLASSLETYHAATDSEVKHDALLNVAFFGLAATELGQNPTLPAEARQLVAEEIGKINAHQEISVSEIVGTKIDYTMFIVRGHYTRTPTLKKYFLAMMWYGTAPFMVSDDKDNLQGLIMTRDLYRSHLDSDWDKIYEPTVFFVGSADDLTPADFKSITDKVYGKISSADALDNNAKLSKVGALARAATHAQIDNVGIPQLRFMGARAIPDSIMTQSVTNWPDRLFPSGLDVMAIMGNKHAASLLDAYPSYYNPGNWDGYINARTKMTAKYGELPASAWRANLYWGWLDSLRTLQAPVSFNSTSFMLHDAWRDKQLDTSLGSWAELRHDTILYGKQSTEECGGGSQPAEPGQTDGYVEPNVAFYQRLIDLSRQAQQGLSSRGILPTEIDDGFNKLDDILAELKEISQKELAGQRLTSDENEFICTIGGNVEYLTLSITPGAPSTWDMVDQADQKMACVADIHRGAGDALEEGVGNASEIFVIVPVDGRLVLARGAVYDWYEFTHPISDRLTDEKWQSMLGTNEMPSHAPWLKSILTGDKPQANGQTQAQEGGC